MQNVNEISKTLAVMPTDNLVALVALAGLGVAAFSIYAVLKIAKERQK